MLNNLRAKLKNPFVKEVLLAVVLFCLPFLLWVHLLFNEDGITVLSLFGFYYNHEYWSDQAFVWACLTQALPMIYFLLSRRFIKKRTWNLLLLVYFFSTEYLVRLIIGGYEPFSRTVYMTISFLLTAIVFYVLLGNVRKDFLHFKETFKKDFDKIENLYLFLIIITLLLWFSWYLPSYRQIEIIDTRLDSLPTFGFPNFNSLIYFLSLKSLMFTTVIILFLEGKKWWKYALLSPILLTVYQIRSIFNEDSNIIDEHEIIQTLPLLGLVLIVLLALSKNAQEQYLFQAIYQKTYTRFEEKQLAKQQKKQEEIEQSRAKLEALKEEPHKKDMEELLELKRQLEEKLSDKK